MKTLLFLLSLISTASFAAQSGAVPSITVTATGANTANVAIPPSDLSGSGIHKIFSLYVGGSAGFIANWLVLYRDGVAYATGSSTKAYCFDITAADASGSSWFQFVSSQAAIANDTSTALTAGVYQAGAASKYVNSTGPTAYVPAVVPGVYVFGDGVHVTYAAIQVSVTAQFRVHMDCYEL